MASTHSKQRSLAELIPLHCIDADRARELKDFAEFIAHATRIAARALRFNASECKRLHGDVHPATPGGIHFLIGLAQEFAAIGRAR